MVATSLAANRLREPWSGSGIASWYLLLPRSVSWSGRHDNGDLQVSALFEPIFEFEDPLIARLNGSHAWRQRRDEAFSGVLVSNALALARFLADVPA